MADASICPAADRLRELLMGGLPDVESHLIAQHLMDCLACQSTTQTLAASETLLNQVRRAGRESVEELPAEVQRVIVTLRDRTKFADFSSPHSETLLSAVDDVIAGSRRPSTIMSDELSALLTRVQPGETAEELGRLADFRLLKLLGHGGMGAVFLAEDVRLQRPVALKLVRADVAGQRDARERFLREARAAASIKHENVVTIYQVGEENGVPFLAQELLEGETLETRLAAQGRFSVDEALRIGQQIAEGLEAAHSRGLMHRDIKPANVFLARNLHSPRAAEIVKLLDFGLARIVSDNIQLTQSGMIIGTPAFMSPEQASGEAIDHRTDLFSLGCLLYVMLTGNRPFRGDNVMKLLASLSKDSPAAVNSLRPEVPAELSSLIDQLLAKSVSERPGTAGEVAARLARLQNSFFKPADVRHPTVTDPPPKRARNSTLALFGGLGAILILGVIIITITDKNGAKSQLTLSDTSTIQMKHEPEVSPERSVATSTMATDMTADGLQDASSGAGKPKLAPSGASVPRLADSSMPYVIFRDGQVVGEFPYLPVELPEYHDGDIIEVRGNGPFRLPQIVAQWSFHLRAAEGYQPVFVPAESVPAQGHWIAVTKGSLRLEGCEFRRMKWDAGLLFVASGDSCDIVNCTLARGGSQASALVAGFCPKVRIQDCLLISGIGQNSFDIHSEVRELSIENSIFLCNSFDVFSIQHCESPRSFRLEHNTFSGSYFVLGGDSLTLEDLTIQIPIDMTVRHNLFTNEAIFVPTDSRVKYKIDDFRSVLVWHGEGNIAPKFGDQALIEELAEPGQAGLVTVPQLRVYGSRAWAPEIPAVDRVKGIQQVLAAEKSTSSELRLNWDQIGPGAGYLRTLDLVERDQQQPDATLEGGPFTLVHPDTPARGFTNLADAVRASQDGDTIELRTNRALNAMLDSDTPGRRLTICAARGYHPKFIDTSKVNLGLGHDWEFINLTFRGSLGYYSRGQIRRLQNCAFDVVEHPPAGHYFGLRLPGDQSPGPDVEVVNCIFPGLTLIDVGPIRKVVVRNSVLQSCQLGTTWSVEGDHHLTLDDCVIWDPLKSLPLLPLGDQLQARAIFSVQRCLFDGFAISFRMPDRMAWSGDQNQFRLWYGAWYSEEAVGLYIGDLPSWQKRWNSDARSTAAPSAYFDPQQWRLLESERAEPSTAGVDFSRFHRPQAFR